MALMHKLLKPYKSTAIPSFLNRACVRMRNITTDTLMVFVLRAVGELAENVQVNFLCGKAISMLL